MDQPTSAGTVAPAPANPPRQLIPNAVPVGVAGFALTTFTLGLYTTGQFNAKGEVLVFALAAFYGGLTQFIAGFFSLRRGDIFQAAFMTTYGAFWWSFDALNLWVAPHAGSGASQAVTIFLIMWTVITFVFLIATLFTNWVVFVVFLEFVVTLIVADIGSAANSVGITHVAGYLELILGALGWYIVLSELVNMMSKRELFPFPATRFNPEYKRGTSPAVGQHIGL